MGFPPAGWLAQPGYLPHPEPRELAAKPPLVAGGWAVVLSDSAYHLLVDYEVAVRNLPITVGWINKFPINRRLNF